MKRLPLILSCLFCAALGFGLSAALQNEGIALAGLCITLIAIWTGYRLVQRWVRKTLDAKDTLTETEIITSLVDHFTTPNGTKNPTPEDRRHAALVNLGLWLARREAVQFSFNATVTVVGGLVGAATLFLLYEQNQKFDIQNQRITLQTDANITQSLLLESARRAALSEDLTQLLTDIRSITDADTEYPNCLDSAEAPCWVVANENAPLGARSNLVLPEALRAEISGFLVRNTPYILAQSKGGAINFDAPLRGQFDFPTLSPERGQVLQALVAGSVSLQGFDFSSAQVQGADLSAGDLVSANLFQADFRNSILGNANFTSSNLIGADLEDAVLFNARLDRTNLSHANLTKASLNQAMMEEVNLESANLSNTDLSGARLRGARLDQAGLFDTQLTAADLTDVDVSNTDLSSAWAWADAPPDGLADLSAIDLCVYEGNLRRVSLFSLDRRFKPDPCVPPDN
ncbi:pentapeptide repeat-containing protein [Tateyamaria sp. syn59]|uniref:pentapeptide repeat-containing protein n=1 Tax=Tateyamaria sp. syn59 TaxID=2576942 RepID=UPI0011BDDB9D|nr:pentapeptide repeat-containing protein [Tateyamaria sp. syn59]